LQILRRKGKEGGLNSVRGLGVWKEELQSGIQNELLVLRRYCNDLEEEKLYLTQECDALRIERDSWKADYDEVKRMHSALIHNLNAFTENHNSLQRGINTLIDQEVTVKMILKKFFSIQEAYLTSTQERDTLRWENGELKLKFEELEREYSTLKEDLGAIREERNALQRDKERLIQLEGGMGSLLNQHSGVQKSLLAVIQERDTLKLRQEELKAYLQQLETECSTLEKDLNIISEDHNALQKQKVKSIHQKGGRRKLDEALTSQKAQLVVTPERESSRFEHNNLKLSFQEIEREYTVLKDNLNMTRKKCDALEKHKRELVHLKVGIKKMLDELSFNQKVLLAGAEGRDTSWSEHDELQLHLGELEREGSALKRDLNATIEKCNALQNDKDKIVHLEVGMRKKMTELSSILKAHLPENKGSDSLKSEHNEWKVNFEKLERECSTLNDNLNATREKCDSLQRDTSKLAHMESGTEKILGELLAIQKALLTEVQERNTLRSEQVELKHHLKDMETECSTLEEDLGAVSEDCEALQREKDMLVYKEGVMSKKMEELLMNQKARLPMTQDREALRPEQNELKGNCEKLEKECITLKDYLNTTRENYDAFLKDTHELVDMKGGIKQLLDEIFCNQKALLGVSLEREILSSEHLVELARECSTIKQGLNDVIEKCNALQNDKDKIIYLEVEMRKKLDELLTNQKSQLAVTQERDTLRLEQEELNANFEELERECGILKNNLSIIGEESEALQRSKDKLVDLEGGMGRILNEVLAMQKAFLEATQERDNLRSKNEELKVTFEKLQTECCTLKKNLIAIRKGGDALQKEKDKLVLMGCGMRKVSDEISGFQKTIFAVSQERDTLRWKHQELKVSSEELGRACTILNENLNVIREKCDALEQDKDKLVHLEGGMERILSDLLSVQKTLLAVTQEGGSLRSEHEQLKVSFEELETECASLNDNLSVEREKYDALLKQNGGLVQLRDSMRKLSDKLWAIQMAFLAVIQERDTLRLEHEEFKVNTDQLERECTALKDNLNDITEKSDALQKSRDKLVDLEVGTERMFNKLLAIQRDFLAVTQERDTLRLEHEELKVRFEELETECVTLKKDLIPIRQGGDTLQKDKDKLVHLECGMKKIFDELSGIQKSLFVVTQERDTLRSQHEELKVNTQVLKRECNSLNANIGEMRESCDALQLEKDKVMDLEGELIKKLDEMSSIRKDYLLVIKERNALRSEHNKLKVTSEGLVKKCSSLEDDLNAVRGKCDELQKMKHSLTGLEATLEVMLGEQPVARTLTSN
jgi:chromosome segregation ATPase